MRWKRSCRAIPERELGVELLREDLLAPPAHLTELTGAGLMIEPSLLAASTHQSSGVSDYLRLAWLASTIATAGGALGGLLETDVAVREAAYAYRPEEDPAPPAAAS